MARTRDDDAASADSVTDTTRRDTTIVADDGSVFRADVYTSIDVTADPDLWDDLLDGTLNTVRGPDGATVQLAVPVAIHDPEARRFGLYLPTPIRHRALAEKRRLLSRLEASDDHIPAYVLNPDLVVDPARWREDEPDAAPPSDLKETDEVRPSAGTRGTSAPASDPEEDEHADIEAEWEKIEREREELATREQQLEEVRDRIDRERDKLDDTETELERERRELEQLRQELEQERTELEAERLQFEDRQRRDDEPDSPDEITQVVTDDQFVEVTDDPDASSDQLTSDERTHTSAEPGIHPVDPDPYTDLRERAADHPTLLDDGGDIIAAACIDPDRLQALRSGRQALFTQCHDIDGTPVAAITFASLDDEDAVRASVGWPTDIFDDHRSILNRLSEQMELTVVLFADADHDEDAPEPAAFRVNSPLESNLEWIREHIAEITDEDGVSTDAFQTAATEFVDPAFDRVGSMTHNFGDPMFRDAQTPAELKLATSVLGYWSEPNQFEYLVANRSYPLDDFRRMRRAVVDRAVQTGIFLPESLRTVAIDQGIASDEPDLLERLLANFSEVSVRLKSNDLDAEQEWENWESLLDTARELGVTIDQEVVELAEASLTRAREQREMEAENPGGLPNAQGKGAAHDESSAPTARPSASADDSSDDPDHPADADGVDDAAIEQTEVVGRESESTGVTYFLPDSAVIDTFDDLADVPRDDLEKLLDDANGRLEAAQMLIERFGASTVPTVLEASETMTAAEVSALATFVESQAESLEKELVSALDDGGPSSVYIAARGLAATGESDALPDLLAAYGDPERRLNREALANTLAEFGESLVPALVDAVEQGDGAFSDDAEAFWSLLVSRAAAEHDNFIDQLRQSGDDRVHDLVRATEQRPDLSSTVPE